MARARHASSSCIGSKGMTREDKRDRWPSVVKRKGSERMIRKETCSGGCGESSPRYSWCVVTTRGNGAAVRHGAVAVVVDDFETKGRRDRVLATAPYGVLRRKSELAQVASRDDCSGGRACSRCRGSAWKKFGRRQ